MMPFFLASYKTLSFSNRRQLYIKQDLTLGSKTGNTAKTFYEQNTLRVKVEFYSIYWTIDLKLIVQLRINS